VQQAAQSRVELAQTLYDQAKSKGWPVIRMKNGWNRIFANGK
jgi:hypothetical protein